MKPSLIDVAAHVGVSKSTVSNVLQGKSSVSPEIRTRVLQAVDELGYVRNESARLLRAGKSRTVALVVLDSANPYFTDIARGVQEALESHGLVVILCDSNNDPARELEHLDVLEGMRVRGVILAPVVDPSYAHIRAIRSRGTPIVLIERDTALTDISAAACDDVAGGAMAVRHLLDLGHRDIGFVTAPLNLKPYRDRLNGGREEIRASGIDARLRVFEGATHDDSGADAARQLMAASDRPTAVYCGNDLMALSVEHAAQEHGLRIPEDLSIVGYDDIRLAAAAPISLTTVRQPGRELGAEAARLLLAESESGKRVEISLLKPGVVVRRSTAAP